MPGVANLAFDPCRKARPKRQRTPCLGKRQTYDQLSLEFSSVRRSDNPLNTMIRLATRQMRHVDPCTENDFDL